MPRVTRKSTPAADAVYEPGAEEPVAPPLPSKGETTAVVSWEDQLAAEAQAAAGMEANAGGGAFFSTQGGILAFDGVPLPNNEMAVVVIDHILENVFYEGRFNVEKPTPPTCFALGRDDREMRPHAVVVEAGQAQNPTCHGCPMNEWGSNDTGKGKACRNTRRLAMVPAGELGANGFTAYDNPEHYAGAPVGYLKLPVTSVKAWASLVKQIAGVMHRPPHGVYLRVKVVPDTKTQFKVVFDPLGEIPGSLIPAILARRTEVMATIDFPYQLEEQAGGSRQEGKRPPVKRNNKF